jgi:hypothetical protein
MAKLPALEPQQRLSEEERQKIGAELRRRYDQGHSIRGICVETGYSIGRVRRLLELAGVTFRARGGSRSWATREPRT